MNESEDEFEFQDEKKRVKPRVFVPEPKFKATQYTGGVAPFMQEFVISMKQLQPVKIKMDSVIIKGSKILAKHPKSKYIEGTLFLMAKSYFYQRLWLPAQIKCSELVDRFPDGDMVPDALLLSAKSLLMQQNYPSGKIMLSRTVDYAWQKKRWDILSQAFRIQAELALLEDDIDGALRPYRQAIAQSENDELRAKWQVDMSAIYYRVGRFKEASKSFARVQKYSPDYQAAFEGYLYQAISLYHTGDTLKANRIVKMLENDGKYEEWQSYVLFAKMTKYRIYEQKQELETAETFADSAYMNNTAINAVYFEKAVDFYKDKNYNEARRFFSRAKNKRSMFSKTSNQMYFLLNSWDQKHRVSDPMLCKLDSGEVLDDTSRIVLSQMLFEIGRIHEEMNNPDSTLIFYHKASLYSPASDTMTARYIYAYARTMRDRDVRLSDSLYQVIADKYPRTEYGKDAMKRLGYTKRFIINKPAEIYQSANSLRMNEEYDMSLRQYLLLVEEYPDYKLSPKALYSVGWIWENNLKNIDSALFYYDMLIAKYPNSVYAQDIVSGVSYLTAIKKGEIKPGEEIPKEYFKAKAVNLDKISKREVLTPAEKNPELLKKNEAFNPLDIISDPGKAFNNVIQTLKETGNDLQNSVDKKFQEIKDPKSLMNSVNLNMPKLPGLGSDSTKNDMPNKPEDKKKKKEEETSKPHK